MDVSMDHYCGTILIFAATCLDNPFRGVMKVGGSKPKVAATRLEVYDLAKHVAGQRPSASRRGGPDLF